jgi:hypothetical protein
MAKKAKSKKNKAKNGVTRRYRDAVTGRFVTKKYAKKNRETTVKEPIPADGSVAAGTLDAAR